MGILGSIAGGMAKGIFSVSNAVATSTANGLYTALQNAKTKKDIKALYNQVSNANFENRAVALLPGTQSREQLLLVSSNDENDILDYDVSNVNSAGLDYIYGMCDDPEGVIVSGGTNDERMVALVPFIYKAQNKGLPIFVIHSGNSALESYVTNWCQYIDVISQRGNYYDAFRGLPTEDIAFLLYESMPDELAVPAAESLIHAVVEVIDRLGRDITAKSLADFPLLNLQTQLNDMLKNGMLTKDEYDELNAFYLAGASEASNVRVFFNKLNRQFENVFGKNNLSKCNIKGAINKKGIICIDVGNTGNELLFSLVLNHILFLSNQGKDFAVILDGIPIAKYEKLNDLFRNHTYAVSNSDFISSISGGTISKDELFSEITGSVTRTVLFCHSSGTSCQTWSDYMGKYNKIKITNSITQSSAFMNSSSTSGISVSEAETPRVSPTTLTKLNPYCACIYSAEGILFARVNEPE